MPCVCPMAIARCARLRSCSLQGLALWRRLCQDLHRLQAGSAAWDVVGGVMDLAAQRSLEQYKTACWIELYMWLVVQRLMGVGLADRMGLVTSSLQEAICGGDGGVNKGAGGAPAHSSAQPMGLSWPCIDHACLCGACAECWGRQAEAWAARRRFNGAMNASACAAAALCRRAWRPAWVCMWPGQLEPGLCHQAECVGDVGPRAIGWCSGRGALL